MLLGGFSVLNDSNIFWSFVVIFLTIWLKDIKAVLRSYALTKKEINQKQFSKSFWIISSVE